MCPETIKVEEVMTRDVVSAKVGEPISRVISKLKEYGFHELPVVSEKDELVGLVNYRTLIRRKNLPLSARVDTVMVKPPVLSRDSTLGKAVKLLLETGYRSLPVVEKDKVVGIISRTDIIKMIPKMKGVANIPAVEVMSSDPVVVEENSPVEYAVDVMRRLGEMSVPVVDGHRKLSGTIHMKDIADTLWKEKNRPSIGEVVGEKEKSVTLVKDLMAPPIYVDENSYLKDAVEKMIEFHSHICVVVDKNMQPIGIISQKDVIEAVLKESKQEGVLVQITGLDIEDSEPYLTIYEMAEEYLNKINRFREFRPRLLTFHVEVHHITGKETKYSVRARLTTDRKMFFAKSYDWNLYRAFREVLDILEKSVKKEHEKLLEFRREML